MHSQVCTCVYVCMRMRIYIRACAYTYVHVHIHTCMLYIRAYIRVCYTYVHAHIHACVRSNEQSLLVPFVFYLGRYCLIGSLCDATPM